VLFKGIEETGGEGGTLSLQFYNQLACKNLTLQVFDFTAFGFGNDSHQLAFVTIND
jgi:hypothetical protein